MRTLLLTTLGALTLLVGAALAAESASATTLAVTGTPAAAEQGASFGYRCGAPVRRVIVRRRYVRPVCAPRYVVRSTCATRYAYPYSYRPYYYRPYYPAVSIGVGFGFGHRYVGHHHHGGRHIGHRR